MEKPMNEWIHDGILNGLDCWTLLLPGSRGLFLSMSKLNGLCTIKYSQTTEEGGWHSTIQSEDYFYMPLTESGFTSENAKAAQELGLMLISHWVHAMQAVYKNIAEKIEAATDRTGAEVPSDKWYAPYGHGINPAMYHKKELPDGLTAVIKSDAEGDSWKLTITKHGAPFRSMHMTDAATLGDAESFADAMIAHGIHKEHKPDWIERCQDCVALVETPECPYFCDEAQKPCSEVKTCAEWNG